MLWLNDAPFAEQRKGVVEQEGAGYSPRTDGPLFFLGGGGKTVVIAMEGKHYSFVWAVDSLQASFGSPAKQKRSPRRPLPPLTSAAAAALFYTRQIQ